MIPSRPVPCCFCFAIFGMVKLSLLHFLFFLLVLLTNQMGRNNLKANICILFIFLDEDCVVIVYNFYAMFL